MLSSTIQTSRIPIPPQPQIGSFTAASNITGLCADVDAVTALLHEYGALAFWDYATAAPYLKVRSGQKEGCMFFKSRCGPWNPPLF